MRYSGQIFLSSFHTRENCGSEELNSLLVVTRAEVWTQDSNFRTFCKPMFSVWTAHQNHLDDVRKNLHALAEPQTKDIRMTCHKTRATVFVTALQITPMFSQVWEPYSTISCFFLMGNVAFKNWDPEAKMCCFKDFKIFIVSFSYYLLRVFYVPRGTFLEDTTKFLAVWLLHGHDYHLG